MTDWKLTQSLADSIGVISHEECLYPNCTDSLRQTFGIVALLAVNLFAARPALAAGDLHTAAGVMSGCGNFLAGNDTSLLVQGMCFGF